MKYIIGNWKMKLAPTDEASLSRKVKKVPFDQGHVTVSLHPTFLSLQAVARALQGSSVYLGAQDCFYEDAGAYTGEISPAHLKNLGCEYVIVGHSERRRFAGETDEIINKKVHAVINEHMIPIVCVGETQEQRQADNKDHIVRRQVEHALHDVNVVGAQKLILAYEPVWAIGTSNAATPREAMYMHQVIYHTLLDLFPKSIVAENAFIIYGGSVDPDNIRDFLNEPAVDGVLVGGASTKFDEFSKMIAIANSL